MGFTPKQVRNGATGSGGEQDTARPGPDASGDVAAGKVAAESAAHAHSEDGHSLMGTSQGSGPSASSGVADSDRVLGAGGNFWEWDSGLAIGEMPGEA